MSPSGTPVLSLSGIEKNFGSHRVLNIPGWVISEGIYWIQGENGAGKSTLFRVLAGMLPFSGQIILEGNIDLRKNPVTYRLNVALGEAEPLYPSFLTPADLIAFMVKTRKANTAQAKELADRFGITSYQDQPIGACSSGMIKKLSLAISFLGAPRVIILDEPLITIDREASEVLFQLIKEYRTDSVTFLISSHQVFTSGAIELTQSFALKNKALVPAD